jgi:hypothetical protein
MEAKLENTLPAKKIIMHSLPSMNIFKIQLRHNNQNACILLQMFCGNPLHNRKKKYSFSIVGKIEGVRNLQGHIDILSDYGAGKQLKDSLNFERNQFIFCNQSLVQVVFQIRIRLKGVLPTEKALTAELNIQLQYNLRKIFVNSIATQSVSKTIHNSGFALLQ